MTSQQQFPWERAAALLLNVTAFTGALAAQGLQPPFAQFQYSSLTGSANTITATQVPVVTGSGLTVYVNVTLQFNVDASGALTITSGYPQVISAPTLLSSGFKAGTYIGPSTTLSGKTAINVSGPAVADGGATQWTATVAGGADACTFPLNATWYVGPLTSSPFAARLKAADITSTAWSYGTFNGPNCSVVGYVGNAWYPGTLIGVSQIGNTVTIASFSRGGSIDYNVPQDQITYTLK